MEEEESGGLGDVVVLWMWKTYASMSCLMVTGRKVSFPYV